MEISDQFMNFFYKGFRYAKECLRSILKTLNFFFSRSLLLFDELVGFIFLFFMNSPKKENQKKERPLILICRFNKYGNGKDVSMEKYHLEDTLVHFDVEVISYIWDDLSSAGLNKIRFIKFLRLKSPDVVILSSYTPSPRRTLSQPGNYLLSRIKKKGLMPKCVAIWWDTCSDKFGEMNLKGLNPIDAHVVIDNPVKNLNYSDISEENKHKLLFLYCPYNSDSLFRPLQKNIDFCFLGQVNSYRNSRKIFIDYLKENNIKGYLGTDDRLTQVTHSEYGEIMGHSKIGLNFSYSVDKHQLKSRVFEVMLSGALLLETKNDQTPVLFEDGKDFVSFTTKEDLLEKINYYLSHESELQIIAASGRKKAVEQYSGLNFWKAVFQKIQIDA